MNGPTLGVAVIVINKENNRVLIGARLAGEAAGLYGFPGGKVDFGESIKDAAIREVLEETNLRLNPNTMSYLSTFSEDIFYLAEKHYITTYVVANTLDDSELRNMEPDKHTDWEWLKIEEIPDNNWYPIKEILLMLPDLERIHHWEGLIDHEEIKKTRND